MAEERYEAMDPPLNNVGNDEDLTMEMSTITTPREVDSGGPVEKPTDEEGEPPKKKCFFRRLSKWVQIATLLACIAAVVGVPLTVVYQDDGGSSTSTSSSSNSNTTDIDITNSVTNVLPPGESSPTNPAPTPMQSPTGASPVASPVASPPTSFPVGAPTTQAPAFGMTCTTNEECSGESSCVEEKCTSGLVQADGECDDNDDCANKVCANRNSNVGPKMACCHTGETVRMSFSPYAYYCPGHPGDLCGLGSDHDALCASGVCVDNVCMSGLQGPGDACDSNSDCDTGTCVNKVCTDALVEADGECDDSKDCVNNVCANRNSNVGPKMACCHTGETVRMSFSPYAYYCPGHPGDLCGLGSDHDALCASGVCVDNVCMSGLQGPDDACDSNSDCDTGTCVNKVCTAALVEADGACDDSKDCVNNVCANRNSNVEPKMACCHTGKTVRMSFSPYAYYCPGHPGDLCGLGSDHDALCASGVCVDNVCMSGLQGPGDACDTNSDCDTGTCVNKVCTEALVEADGECDDSKDCVNNVCANRNSNVGPKMACCHTGETVRMSFSPYAYYCPGHPGDLCALGSDHDALCASGVCVDNVCMSGLQGPGDTCDTNSDCDTGTCVNKVCTTALVEADGECDDSKDCVNNVCANRNSNVGPKMACCHTGKTVRMSFSPYAYYCPGHPGDLCALGSDHDGLCASGVCVNNICMEGRQGTGNACDSNTDCESGACVNGACAAAVAAAGSSCDDNKDCLTDSCVEGVCQ